MGDIERPWLSRGKRRLGLEDVQNIWHAQKYVRLMSGNGAQETRVNVSEEVAEITGWSLTSVKKAFSLVRKDEPPASLMEAATRDRESHVSKDAACKLRALVHALYTEKCRPTIAILGREMKRRHGEAAWPWSRETLRLTLIDLGFSYNTASNSYDVVHESASVVVQRLKYIRAVQEHEATGSVLFYYDETWFNKNMAPKKNWVDDGKLIDIGIAPPSGKGPRWILAGMCSKQHGFCSGQQLLFKANGTDADYHKSMDFEMFKRWVEDKAIPFLEQVPNAVFVMDRASYHVILTEDTKPCPSTARKAERIAWLVTHSGKPAEAWKKMTVAELKVACKEHMPEPKYVIVELLKAKGIPCLITPVAHPELNPIENIWAVVKAHVRMHNVEYSMDTLKVLIAEALTRATAKLVQKFCERTEKTAQTYLASADMDGQEDDV